VIRDGVPLTIGGVKQRALLAALLLRANQTVTTARLIDDLWGEERPASATKMVHIYVSRLRQLFGADATSLLPSVPGGYEFRLADTEFDLEIVEAAAAEGRSLAEVNPREAASRFRDALSVWRGAPLDDVSAEPFARVAIPRLEELRRAILDDRMAAELAAGHHQDVLGELLTIAADEPYRERPHRHVMLALYRCGRQPEALEIYRNFRRRIAEEFGLDPSPELRHLEASILAHDPAVSTPPTPFVRPEQAPAVVSPNAPAPAHPGPPANRIRWFVAAAVVIVAVGSTALVAVLHRRGGTDSINRVLHTNSVAVLDASTGRLDGDVRVGANPGPIVMSGSTAWIGSGQDHTVDRVDARRLVVTKTFGLAAPPQALAASGERIWIANGFAGTLSRILAPYNQLSTPFYPDRALGGLLAVAGTNSALWVGLSDGSLVHLDPASLRLVVKYHLDRHPAVIAVSGDSVWAIPLSGDELERVNAADRGTAETIRLPGPPHGLAADAEHVWVAISDPNEVLDFDPATGHAVATYRLQSSPTGVAAAAATAWVVEGTTGDLERVGGNSGVPRMTLHLGHRLGDVAVSGSKVWVTVDSG
jgi:DNA-binding SARP family transcriptional activator